ncbi:MAG TPA: flagellar biosynthetic protein FliR [Gammaproteobacteria bacterium]|nr:flagellar biosynthetic protein FliR [Gammaproteobacteria bacterium]
MQPLTLTTAEITSWLGSFFWPLVRVMAMFSIVPVFGIKQLPVPLKITLAFLLTLAILPFQQNIPSVTPWSASGLTITVQQILIGVAMGLSLQLVFTAMQLAGANIAMSMGLGFAMASDPLNGVAVPVISQFLSITATLLFISMDGHLAIIDMLAKSFQYLPVSTIGIGPEGIWHLLQWASVIFSGAIAVAIPAIIALLAVNLTMGIMTRAAPQLNIFSIGFPITLMAGFLLLYLMIPNIVPVFERMVDAAFSEITRILQGQ